MRDLSSLVISLFGAMEMALLKLILWGLKSGNGIVKLIYLKPGNGIVETDLFKSGNGLVETDLFKSGNGFVETDFMGIKI